MKRIVSLIFSLIGSTISFDVIHVNRKRSVTRVKFDIQMPVATKLAVTESAKTNYWLLLFVLIEFVVRFVAPGLE